MVVPRVILRTSHHLITEIIYIYVLSLLNGTAVSGLLGYFDVRHMEGGDLLSEI